MNWRDRITVDPAVCHGKACIRGTRVLVSVVLDSLGADESPDEVATAYGIDLLDIRAALQYAAELTKERVVPLSTGTG